MAKGNSLGMVTRFMIEIIRSECIYDDRNVRLNESERVKENRNGVIEREN